MVMPRSNERGIWDVMVSSYRLVTSCVHPTMRYSPIGPVSLPSAKVRQIGENLIGFARDVMFDAAQSPGLCG